MMGYSPKSFEAVRANRQPLLTALAALGITELVVRYEGGGDSGDVCELDVFPSELANTQILETLKTQQLAYQCLAGEYRKTDSGPTANQGAVYVVAGSSGWATYQLDPNHHPAMFQSELEAGSMVIDVAGHRLDAAFATRTLAEWKEVLADFEGVWSPFQTLDELYDDVQVQANGYLPTMTAGNGQEVQLVASPAMFDEEPVTVERAPEHGEHTELVLMEAGYDWDQIAAMKESGAIL